MSFLTSRSPVTAPAVLWQGSRTTSTLLFSTVARTEVDINTAVQYCGKDQGGHQHCCSVLWQGPRRTTSTLLFSTVARTEVDINTAVQYCGKDRGGLQHCCSILWQGPRRTSTLLFNTVARTEADINTAVQYCGKDEADDINSDNALDHFHVFHHRKHGSPDCQFSVPDDTGNDETVLNRLHALRQTCRKVP